MPKLSEAFRENIERRLAELNKNRAWLAGELGVAKPNITQLLRPDTNPKLDMIEAVASKLETEPSELIRPMDPKAALPPKGMTDLIAAILKMDKARAEHFIRIFAKILAGPDRIKRNPETDDPVNKVRKK